MTYPVYYRVDCPRGGLLPVPLTMCIQMTLRVHARFADSGTDLSALGCLYAG